MLFPPLEDNKSSPFASSVILATQGKKRGFRIEEKRREISHEKKKRERETKVCSFFPSRRRTPWLVGLGGGEGGKLRATEVLGRQKVLVVLLDIRTAILRCEV